MPKLLPSLPAGIGPLRHLTRGIYALLMLAIAFGVMIHPIGFPMKIDSKTQDFYNQIYALKPGDAVIWVDSTDQSGYTMIRDMYRSVAQFMASRGLKLIYVPIAVQTASNWLANIEYSGLESRFNYVNGRDFAVVGFMAGEEVALAVWADNGFGELSTDAYGRPISSDPLLQQVGTVDNAKLVYIGASSFTLGQQVVRQWLARYPNLKGIASLAYGGIATYYGKYIFGCLDGVRGYAEFETLTGFLGSEVVSMDAKNLHIILWLVVMFALNIEYHYYRMKPKKFEEGQVQKEGT
jgi:hypothetical protein